MGKVATRRARVIDEIVDAATRVMAESGAAALSLGEVARRMGMRTPSLYGYFANRNDLCDEVFRRGWESYGHLTSSLDLTPDTDLRAQLTVSLLDAVRWANDNRAAAELMFWRPIPHWQPSPEAFVAAIEVVNQTGRLVADAQDAGLLRPDADVVEMNEVLGALFSGVISQQLSNEPGVDAGVGRISRHARAFAEMFAHHYGTH